MISPNRKFTREQNIYIVENKAKHKRYIFLFNDMVIFARPLKAQKSRGHKEYAFIERFLMQDLKIVDIADFEGTLTTKMYSFLRFS